ncbi:hypothetical protein B0H13DRAFT_2380559 [Mycena leptocephala]|nr:hypothetical protein B0H13DRAFT_2380559 [Mycena leptocephala]
MHGTISGFGRRVSGFAPPPSVRLPGPTLPLLALPPRTPAIPAPGPLMSMLAVNAPVLAFRTPSFRPPAAPSRPRGCAARTPLPSFLLCVCSLLSPLRVLCPVSLMLMLMRSARSPFGLRISSPTTTDAWTNSSDSASGSACNDYLQRTADGLRSSARSTGNSTSAGGKGTSRVFPSPFSVLFPTLSLPARVFPYPKADNEKDDN